MAAIEQMRKIFAVVLAAGSASRFGSTKQLAEFDGVPLVQRALDVAAEVCGDNTVLVLGHDWKAVADACAPLAGFIVINDEYANGLGSSIARAMQSVRDVTDAVIVLLADQALVSGEHLQALCAAWSGANDEIVATAYADTFGVPALFARGCFKDLADLQGDAGARQLMTDRRFRLKKIVFEPAAVDVDTPDDLKRISRNARS